MIYHMNRFAALVRDEPAFSSSGEEFIAYRTGEVMQLQGHKVRILLGELATWVIILFALALFLSFI